MLSDLDARHDTSHPSINIMILCAPPFYEDFKLAALL